MFFIGICDDDIHMLAYLGKLCQKILPECKVVTYQTGSELLKSQTNFDMILIDIKMEGPDGLETVRKLRGNTTKIPACRAGKIGIAGYKEVLQDGLEAGLPMTVWKSYHKEYDRLMSHSM